MKLFITGLILNIFLSCNPNTKGHTQIESVNDASQADLNNGESYDRTENLKLSVDDTIRRTSAYFFSNLESKDRFLLTIEPGLVKDSKSSLKIITATNEVIYTEIFDTYYFIKWIYEPDTVPTTGGQDAFVKYMENYAKSITPKQYKAYFENSINTFFEAIVPVSKIDVEELEESSGGIHNEKFYNECLADSTIKLIDVTCFDCDEGASVIGYSRDQQKVVTLLEHD